MTVTVLRRFTQYSPHALYVLSGALVLFGGYFLAQHVHINRCSGHHFGYTSWLSNWDGQWYQYIAHRGYHYDLEATYGPQAFFPLYPLLGGLLEALSPFYGQLPLIAVSWSAAWGLCLVWLRYATDRLSVKDQHSPVWGLALILFWPASYFLRIAYTEALYMFLLALFFLGCAKNWHPAYLIGVTGLLTATKPLAVLACVVLAFHLFRRYRAYPLPKRLLTCTTGGVLSAWGLYAYMSYLYLEFGSPLIFVEKQAAWNYQMPADIFFRRWREMLSLRPAWGFLIDGSLSDPGTYPWNLQNRGMWLVSLILTAIGRLKRWLSMEEAVFCLLTVLVVYYTHGPKNMESIGRYIFSLVPLYLVMTNLMLKLPVAMRIGLLAMSATLLTFQSAYFRLWACVF